MSYLYRGSCERPEYLHDNGRTWGFHGIRTGWYKLGCHQYRGCTWWSFARHFYSHHHYFHHLRLLHNYELQRNTALFIGERRVRKHSGKKGLLILNITWNYFIKNILHVLIFGSFFSSIVTEIVHYNTLKKNLSS